MELLVIILSGFLSLLVPVGFVGDQIAAREIGKRFEKVEQLQVRIDNAPSYQILQGKLERVRIAGRGIWFSDSIRIEALELETDAIDVDLGQRQQGLPLLQRAFQAGIRAELTAEDLNRFLRSQLARQPLEDLSADLLSESELIEARRYELLDPRVDFLENGRFRVQLNIQEVLEDAVEVSAPYRLSLTVESGLRVVSGRRLQLAEPTVRVMSVGPDGREDNETVPNELLDAIATGLERAYDLKSLQKVGITARLLHLEIQSDRLELAAFVKVEPTVTFSGH